MNKFFQKLFNASIFDTVDSYNIYTRIFISICIVAIVWIIGAQVKKIFISKLKKKLHDPLLAEFISNLFRFIIILIGILMALKVLGMGNIATSIMAGAGISAFIIGFALKDIGENFLAGIILAFNRPFRVGDLIECDNIKARVTALNLRDTELKTSDGKNVFLPNSILIKNALLNYTLDGKLRHEFNIRVQFGSDYKEAKRLIEDVVFQSEDILKDDLYAPLVHISEVSNDGYMFTIYYWMLTDSIISATSVKTELFINIMLLLENKGHLLGGEKIKINLSDTETK